MDLSQWHSFPTENLPRRKSQLKLVTGNFIIPIKLDSVVLKGSENPLDYLILDSKLHLQ